MNDYLELAKQYQKPYQKQHQKQQHESLPDYGSMELPEWRKEPDHILLANEVDYFFWNKLIQLGWRINTEFPLSDKKAKLKSVQFLFLCPDCDKALHSQQSHTISLSKAKTMTDALWLKSLVTVHKVDTKKGCYPAEYDENGDVISEAIPEEKIENRASFTNDSTFDNILAENLKYKLDLAKTVEEIRQILDDFNQPATDFKVKALLETNHPQFDRKIEVRNGEMVGISSQRMNFPPISR